MRRLRFLTSCLAILLVYSCGKKTTPTAPMQGALSVSQDTVTVTYPVLTGTFSVSSTSSAGLAWRVGARPAWVSIAPDSGVATQAGQTITVTASTAGLAYGDHWGSVVLAAAGDTATLIVRLRYAGPPASDTLVVSPDTVTVSSTSPSGTVSVSTNSTPGLPWSVAGKPVWTIISPTSGSATQAGQTMTVTANTAGLAHGVLLGNVLVASASDTATLIVKLLNPAPPAPDTLAVSPDTLTISDASPSGNVSISTNASSPQGWTVTSKPAWVNLLPSSGSATQSPQTITVTGDVTGLSYGDHWGTVAIASLSDTVRLVTKLTYSAPAPRLVDFDWYRTNSCGGEIAIDNTGQLYEACNGGGWAATYRLNGTPVALEAEDHENRNVQVLMQNGDLYAGSFASSPVVWPPVLVGNIVGAANVIMVGLDWYVAIDNSNTEIAIDNTGQLYEQSGGVWTATYRLNGTPVDLRTNIGGPSSDTFTKVAVLMQNGDLFVGDTSRDPNTGRVRAWPPQLVANVASGAASAPMSGFDLATNVAIDNAGQLYEVVGGAWTATYRLNGTPVALKSYWGDDLYWANLRNVDVFMQNGDHFDARIYPSPVVWPPVLIDNAFGAAPSAAQATRSRIRSAQPQK